MPNPDVQLFFYNSARDKAAPRNLLLRMMSAIREYPSIIRGVYYELKIRDIDVLHYTSSASLGLIRDLIFAKIARSFKAKSVVHFRFGRTPAILKANNWECFLLKRVLSSVDKAIFLDESSYFAVKNCGFDNVSLLPNPLSNEVNELITQSEVKKRVPRSVLFVGHCYKEKGVYELAQACASIHEVKLKFVGSITNAVKNDLMRFGRDFISANGEESYESIIRDMLSCDVFVLPSYTEGFPNVLLEAMACGCAIVATRVGAIPEMLDENGADECGLIVQPRDVEGLREAIVKLLGDEISAENYRIKAKQRVESLYSMSAVWARMTKLWKSLNC